MRSPADRLLLAHRGDARRGPLDLAAWTIRVRAERERVAGRRVTAVCDAGAALDG